MFLTTCPSNRLNSRAARHNATRGFSIACQSKLTFRLLLRVQTSHNKGRQYENISEAPRARHTHVSSYRWRQRFHSMATSRVTCGAAIEIDDRGATNSRPAGLLSWRPGVSCYVTQIIVSAPSPTWPLVFGHAT